ncbi:MAG: hypothetical protein Kow0065_11880 [Methylomicrobium sp.]
MALHLLNDRLLKTTKPTDKTQRLSDGGLYLLVKPNGAKWWRFDYTFDSLCNTVSFGVYPHIGLADARRKAEEARTGLANGTDPSEKRKEAKAAKQAEIERQA